MTTAEFIAKRDSRREQAEACRRLARSSMAALRFRGVIRLFSDAREHDRVARNMTLLLGQFQIPEQVSQEVGP